MLLQNLQQLLLIFNLRTSVEVRYTVECNKCIVYLFLSDGAGEKLYLSPAPSDIFVFTFFSKAVDAWIRTLTDAVTILAASCFFFTAAVIF